MPGLRIATRTQHYVYAASFFESRNRTLTRPTIVFSEVAEFAIALLLLGQVPAHAFLVSVQHVELVGTAFQE